MTCVTAPNIFLSSQCTNTRGLNETTQKPRVFSSLPLDGDKSPMELEMPSRCLLPIVIALEIEKEIKKENRMYGEPKLASFRAAVR